MWFIFKLQIFHKIDHIWFSKELSLLRNIFVADYSMNIITGCDKNKYWTSFSHFKYIWFWNSYRFGCKAFLILASWMNAKPYVMYPLYLQGSGTMVSISSGVSVSSFLIHISSFLFYPPIHAITYYAMVSSFIWDPLRGLRPDWG